MRPGGPVTVRALARRAWGWHTLAPGVAYACEGTASPQHVSDLLLRYQRGRAGCPRWRVGLVYTLLRNRMRGVTPRAATRCASGSCIRCFATETLSRLPIRRHREDARYPLEKRFF